MLNIKCCLEKNISWSPKPQFKPCNTFCRFQSSLGLCWWLSLTVQIGTACHGSNLPWDYATGREKSGTDGDSTGQEETCACFTADPHDKKCHIWIKDPQIPTHYPELGQPNSPQKLFFATGNRSGTLRRSVTAPSVSRNWPCFCWSSWTSLALPWDAQG